MSMTKTKSQSHRGADFASVVADQRMTKNGLLQEKRLVLFHVQLVVLALSQKVDCHEE